MTSGAATRGEGVMLACRDLWKLYGARARALLAANGPPPGDELLARGDVIVAVREVTLEVVRGEVFVIMGLSGSGKSTLVRLMTGLAAPTRGHIHIDGIDIARLAAPELVKLRRHKMGMVFQDFALLPHLTVLGNVAFPLKVHGVERKAREARAREMIELVGLGGRERYYPHELSGGQQQRVGIARSLTTEPEVWFLDEPFSALDPLIRREMQEELQRLQRLLRKTIVFITHDFDEAIRLADRIAIMQDGRVVQTGTPEALVLEPATPYVAEFTRDIPRARVLSVGAVAGAAMTGLDGEPVPAASRVEAVAERVLARERPLPVVDAQGALVGAIDRRTVTRVLLNQPLA